MEAVSMGSKLLLIDEDRSATNFMIRDSRMRELVKKEPITPFTERVRELYETKDVSTVLVIGGSGEEDGTTGIDHAEFKNQNSELIYDLQGRRVENPTKGVYIVNGVKRVF